MLTSPGEVITIQVELNEVGGSASILEEEFNDAEVNGLFVNNMILITILENRIYDYYSIMEKIIDRCGDYDVIDGITALMRVNTGNISLEMTVEIEGRREFPNLLESTNNAMYFELVRYVQTRWILAKTTLSKEQING